MRWLLGIACVVGVVFSVSFVDETPWMTVLLGGTSAVILLILFIGGMLSFPKRHDRWRRGGE